MLRKREVEVEEQRERDRKIDKEIGKERHTDYGIKELNSQHTGHIISENSKTSFFILLLALNYNYVLRTVHSARVIVITETYSLSSRNLHTSD